MQRMSPIRSLREKEMEKNNKNAQFELNVVSNLIRFPILLSVIQLIECLKEILVDLKYAE